MNNEDNRLFNTIILYLFGLNEQQEWYRLRNKAIESQLNIKQEYENYFNKIFKSGITSCRLPANTSLFRARQIKTDDESKICADFHEIVNSYCKIFLTDEDINKIKISSDPYEQLFKIQLVSMMIEQRKDDITSKQRKSLDEFIKKYSHSAVYGFSKEGSGVPPEKTRKAGRLNTAKDEYLYLAFDKDTAIHEMRPSIGQKYSIAEFQTKKELKLADLTGKNISMNEDNIILFFLADMISEPNTESNDEFYYITQCMSNFFERKKFDGLMYKSSLHKNKNNILLFNEKNVDFIHSEIVTINDVKIDFANILPLSEK